MRKISILVFLCALTVVSCKTNFNVVHIKDSNYQIEENGCIYALPRVFFEININVEKTQFIAGPYSHYANKYLGIENVYTENSELYHISSVSLTPLYEPDPAALFFVDAGNNPQAYKIAVSSNGIINGYNVNETETAENIAASNPIVVSKPQSSVAWFTDLTVKRNFSDIQDTTYRVIKTDSVYQKIPIINTKITSKDTEQKAEEAANFIIKTRKRRFKLETAQTEQIPDGIAMEKMIMSLNELENKYLELFTGKEYNSIETYRLYFTPEKTTNNVVLFWFSIEEGISDTKKEGFYPLAIQIENVETTGEIAGFYGRQTEFNPKYKGLYYRIPGQAKLKVMFYDICYSNSTYTIPQFGYLNFLDSKLMNCKNIQIDFDNNTGAIRTIR